MWIALLSHIPAFLTVVGLFASAAKLELTWQDGSLDLPGGGALVLSGLWLPGWLLWLMAWWSLS